MAEALGLGTTLALGVVLAPHVETLEGHAAVLGTALLAILLGIVLEGFVVGWFQGAVLHRRRPELSLRSWVIATAAGAGLAWLLGMIPSTLFALFSNAGPDVPTEEPGAAVQVMLAVLLGGITGPILGVAQWVVLRGRIARSLSWLWANALAWAVGMPIIFAGMDRVPWEEDVWSIVPVVYGVCLLTGLVVGAIHGVVMMRLTR